MGRGVCAHQEDALSIAGVVYQDTDLKVFQVPVASGAVIAVADGIASTPSASLASRCVVEAVTNDVSARPAIAFDQLVCGGHVRAAHEKLCDAMRAGRIPRGSASTLVAIQLGECGVAIVNSGDSRAYRIRGDGRADVLSRDHTELQRLIESGEANEGVDYAQIYDALTDCIIADAEYDDFAIWRATVTVDVGDTLILCSDGVYSVMDRDWPCGIQVEDPLRAARELRQAILDRGAPDNFSFVIVRAM
jgi:serine/threonine protein phosphatase PrpC